MNGKAVDLLFVLDGSGSVGQKTFDKQKKFVNLVVSRLNISDNATRVAVLQYSDEAKMEIKLQVSNKLKLSLLSVFIINRCH